MAETGSPSSSAASAIVETGPSAPVCAAAADPILSIANITRNTGSTVHSVPLISDSHQTGAGCTSSAPASTASACTMQARLATMLAQAVSRTGPSRLTISPLPTR